MAAGSPRRKSCLSSPKRALDTFSSADMSNRPERASDLPVNLYDRAYRSRIGVRWESHTYEHLDESDRPTRPSHSFSFDNLSIRGSPCAALLHESVRACLPPKFLRAPKPSQLSFEFLRCKDPRKGWGMFSRRYLPMGGLIDVETPAAIAPLDITSLGMSSSRMHSTLFHLLTPKALRSVTELSNPNATRGSAAYEDIMRANALIVHLKANDKKLQAHHALFLNTSRCNHRYVYMIFSLHHFLTSYHSCSPNAAWSWNKDTFSLSLVAVRPISVGEEITISYVDASLSRRQRQERLAKLYHFHCQCEACTYKWTPSSDRNRAELHDFWNKTCSFEDWCMNRKLPDDELIQIHERALDLRDQEGLQQLDYQKHVDAIVLCYGALSDWHMFQEWIAHAMACRADSDVDHVLVMELWHEQPTRFPVWGWRPDETYA